MKLVSRLLDGDNSEWTDMIRYFIRQETRKKKYPKETRWWSPKEALILLPSFTCKPSLTMKHLLKAWKRARQYLRFDCERIHLPGSMTWRQIAMLMATYANGSPFNNRTFAPTLKKLRSESLMSLTDSRGEWINLHQLVDFKSIPCTPDVLTEIHRLQIWLRKVSLCQGTLQESPSWRWRSEQSKWSGWKQSTNFWTRLMMSTRPIPKQPSDAWNITRGGARALKMQVSDGICSRCLLEEETIEHLMRNCSEARGIWNQWAQIRQGTGKGGRMEDTLLEEIIEGIKAHNRNPAKMHMVVAITTNIWMDRNQSVYRRIRSPLRISFQEVQRTIEADMQENGSEDNWNQGIAGLETLRSWSEFENASRPCRTLAQHIDSLLEGASLVPISTQETERLESPAQDSNVERSSQTTAPDRDQRNTGNDSTNSVERRHDDSQIVNLTRIAKNDRLPRGIHHTADA
ncbi:hypothetical protein R1sor_007621 [Riccia sorocarpa]|uniref:Reverse transcriptase zinc-binding domain-containing protein n=1 Tax=Riccia sorocarpa TaxID=122646 RepID=A0ABD3HUM0_9MARC